MSNPRRMIELQEFNEAGSLLSTYVQSDGQISEITRKDALNRIDVVASREKTSFLTKWFEVVLPAGYPHSVTADYLPYKIYDALQAFSSTIAGLLASRAVLQGVGVGDATASATGALLLSVFQDSAGRVATIMFAHKLGGAIEPECKRYRLAADIFNDTAMIADCLSPAFPKPVRVMVLSIGSVLRALCGVAASSSKATLTSHFAKWGNIGELNAKDASQGNAISLVGMLVGSFVVSWLSSPLATWIAMLLLLSLHLSMNYGAVRAVQMRSLNRQRANILFSHMLAYDKVLSPRDVSKHERIFEWNGVLRWSNDQVIGSARIGVSIQEVVRTLAAKSQHPMTKSIHLEDDQLGELLDIYKDEEYVLWFDWKTSTAMIILKKGISARAQLKAWCQGLFVAKQTSTCTGHRSTREVMALMTTTLAKTTEVFKEHISQMSAAGWLVDIAALETQSGLRLVMHAPGTESRAP